MRYPHLFLFVFLSVLVFALGAAATTLASDPCSIAGGQSSCQPAEMNLSALWELIQARQALGQPVSEQWTEFHQRFALPLAPFFTTLLVAPLALIAGRWGASFSVGLSMMLVFVWYLIYASLRPLGQMGLLEPFLAAWAQNLLFAACGLLIWLWLNRQGNLSWRQLVFWQGS